MVFYRNNQLKIDIFLAESMKKCNVFWLFPDGFFFSGGNKADAEPPGKGAGAPTGRIFS